MARERPTASIAVPPSHDTTERERSESAFGLTRAEAHALRRSAPLTTAQFRSLRLLAEQGKSPLRHI